MYDDELDMILEDAYEDGYYQALADMGYEFDDAEEDVDIFDEDCFDDAVESSKARQERRRVQREELRKSGLTDFEIDAKVRAQRQRNSVKDDPRMLPKGERDMKDYDTPVGRQIRENSNKRRLKQLKKQMNTRDARRNIVQARSSQYTPLYTDGKTESRRNKFFMGRSVDLSDFTKKGNQLTADDIEKLYNSYKSQ